MQSAKLKSSYVTSCMYGFIRLIFSNMEELPPFTFLMNAFRCSANETSILGKKGRQPGASNTFVHFLLGGCDTR